MVLLAGALSTGTAEGADEPTSIIVSSRGGGGGVGVGVGVLADGISSPCPFNHCKSIPHYLQLPW